MVAVVVFKLLLIEPPAPEKAAPTAEAAIAAEAATAMVSKLGLELAVRLRYL